MVAGPRAKLEVLPANKQENREVVTSLWGGGGGANPQVRGRNHDLAGGGVGGVPSQAWALRQRGLYCQVPSKSSLHYNVL